MPKIQLNIKAEAENIGSISAPADFQWMFKIKCTNCHEEHDKLIVINEEETAELNGSRGSANFVYRCKFCKKESNMNIEKRFVHEHHNFAPFLLMDCRGMEPIDFFPNVGLIAKSTESETVFTLDFTEGEWCDYDEKGKCAVSVAEIHSQFIKV